MGEFLVGVGLVVALQIFVIGPCNQKFKQAELKQEQELQAYCAPKCKPYYILYRNDAGECVCDTTRKKVK